jgi:hypothetical protein
MAAILAWFASHAIFGTIGRWIGLAFDWLHTLPWYDFAIAAAVGFGAYQHVEAKHWHKLADARQVMIDATIKAQAVATAAAKSNQVAKAAAHADNAKEITHENASAHAAADGTVAGLRLRIKDLERRGIAGPMPGASHPAGEADDQIDARLPLADELALRQSCEATRIDHDSLIDWEVHRIKIESAPAPAIPPATEESR